MFRVSSDDGTNVGTEEISLRCLWWCSSESSESSDEWPGQVGIILTCKSGDINITMCEVRYTLTPVCSYIVIITHRADSASELYLFSSENRMI